MVRYFFAFTPLVIVFGTAVLLTIPYLALIALMIVALAALAGLVWAIVYLPYLLVRAIERRWQQAVEARPAGRPNAQPVFGKGHVA